MKTLHIARGPSTDEGTFGVAQLDNQTWVSLELPDRDNAPNVSRIPAGTYDTDLVYSAKFQRMVFRLEDVPGRSNVEIHPANWAGDVSKGFYSDLHGCITIGVRRGTLQNPNKRVQNAVMASAQAMDRLEAMVGQEELQVVIT